MVTAEKDRCWKCCVHSRVYIILKTIQRLDSRLLKHITVHGHMIPAQVGKRHDNNR